MSVSTLIGNMPDLTDSQLENWLKVIGTIKNAARKIGEYPIFLRTGMGSGKHNWRTTCFVEAEERISAAIQNLAEWSEMVDFLGLPSNVFAIRKLLKTEPIFYAFTGRMPVTKEFRFRITRNGEIKHIQPYWPPSAIEHPVALDGQKLTLEQSFDLLWPLGELSMLEQAELKTLCRLTAEALGPRNEDEWSVDFLWAEKKWWLIDMALAEQSFWWDGNFARDKAEALAKDARRQKEIEEFRKLLRDGK